MKKIFNSFISVYFFSWFDLSLMTDFNEDIFHLFISVFIVFFSCFDLLLMAHFNEDISNDLIPNISLVGYFWLFKVPVMCFESHSYLTGVPAKLQKCLSNKNMIWYSKKLISVFQLLVILNKNAGKSRKGIRMGIGRASNLHSLENIRLMRYHGKGYVYIYTF